MHTHLIDITKEKRFLGSLGQRLTLGGGVAGIVGLAVSFGLASTSEDGIHRLWWSYLHNWTFFLTIALGALFFVLVEHLAKAGWSVVLRRLSEGVSMTLVLLAILFVPLIFGLHDLYHWLHADLVAQDHVLQHKASYLNQTFFLVRVAVYFLFWIGAAFLMHRNSVKQDQSGDHLLTGKMEALSAPFMMIFALTTTFASFDLLMSLDPHWFSTIFGVYFFAGSFMSFLAFLSVIIVGLQRSGRLTGAITDQHLHDVGKFLFAMLVFWAYIAFSQYLLIWYGNLPEETGWYLRRQTGTWSSLGIVMIFGHFLIPFLFLLSRHIKRRPLLLSLGALWLLVMHWLDLYWLIMPEYDHALTAIPFSLLDLSCLVGIGGFFIAAWAWFLRRCSLIAEKDPRLAESLTFENA